ncbi:MULTISPECIES: acyl-CoA dehydrogenase family protein [Rhodococcus]|uniref:Acyl-CoA dehydrogenase family protein n=1 Tax=Rhodococcus aetherivorans TaxID=191292 RepID=A0AA46PPK1_9NOCA|nr:MULTISPECIES: acyl-CoA dehydrogenase family protein [Rhodococcus]MBC2590145.1 acyl-CoA dehydrogenase family protein [Rhodococcus aetherivorans]QRI76921.1 acyl-CoA dehydrogenase family protein [Rhodococcus aetherivorans]QSE60338.1 acyl-CoA dehydrogenase family protein [Rhodococcus sp. PSBB066]QSE68355.1 acyl-CoA dehydrogenase family protein [Rhodococcus sp. PSBB049]UYF94567.1 acyl-CoA dehydrogenase family protein [Rhodococcus aetherivorans]
MNFELDTEQDLLRKTVRDVLSGTYDTETRNKVADTDRGWSDDVWRQLAELGVLGLPFAEEHGGMGAGPVEVMAVMGEIGRALAPEPLLNAVFLPGGLVAEVGTDEQRADLLPRLSEGALLLAFAHDEPGSRWPATEVATTAARTGDTWALTGRKNPVLHGDCAETFVVSARLPQGGVGLFLVDADAAGVTRTAYGTHDERRAAQLVLDSAAAVPLGEAVDATAAITAAQVRAQAALCAEAVGALAETLRLTTDYLKQRKQFGAPLARFQALTHRAADMYVLLELASSMSLYATMALADGIVDPTIASRAKLQVGRSARKVGQEAIQMHGGIGITAEYPVGHYVSRLTAIEHTLGTVEDHVRILAGAVADHDRIEVAGM